MNIQTLIAGSTRIDRLRKEIQTVSNLVLKGLLSEYDYRRHPGLRPHGLVLAELPDYSWTLLHGPGGPQLRMHWKHGGGVPELMCSLPEKVVSIQHVETVHAHLGAFVEGISKAFPSLEKDWKHIRLSAKEDLKIVYSIKLVIDGGLVKYQKLSNLTFPLPLHTKLTLSVDGDIVIGRSEKPRQLHNSDTFQVTGHQHSAYDEFGVLVEDMFEIELEPDHADKPYTNNILVSLLEANGWNKNEF